MDYTYDTQLLLEGKNLSDREIIDYITANIEGDCLLVVGDDELVKLHFHTNTPWKVLEYCASLGEVYDVVIENMVRQAQGLQEDKRECQSGQSILITCMGKGRPLSNMRLRMSALRSGTGSLSG